MAGIRKEYLTPTDGISANKPCKGGIIAPPAIIIIKTEDPILV